MSKNNESFIDVIYLSICRPISYQRSIFRYIHRSGEWLFIDLPLSCDLIELSIDLPAQQSTWLAIFRFDSSGKHWKHNLASDGKETHAPFVLRSIFGMRCSHFWSRRPFGLMRFAQTFSGPSDGCRVVEFIDKANILHVHTHIFHVHTHYTCAHTHTIYMYTHIMHVHTHIIHAHTHYCTHTHDACAHTHYACTHT